MTMKNNKTRLKEGQPLENTDKIKIQSSQFNNSLTISKAEQSDEGQYTVVASNQFGRASFSATLVVHGSLDI